MDLKKTRLNKEIPIPLYYQLKEILLEHIKESKQGESIPTELELCEQFNISRPTVRQAVNELVVEGYLERLKGKGTFISRSKIRQDFLIYLESFNSEMKRKGLTPTTRVLEFIQEKCDQQVSEALRIKKGSEVIKLRRLRLANVEPIVVVLTFLPARALPGFLLKDLVHGSLYDIIEKEYGLTIDRAMRTLESISAGEYEAELLQIEKGSPIQYIETITYLVDGNPIEFSKAHYRGDRNKFRFELLNKR
jgi:GntR family transcriptional regulator